VPTKGVSDQRTGPIRHKAQRPLIPANDAATKTEGREQWKKDLVFLGGCAIFLLHPAPE
jgi:hypothetical protein